MSEAVVAYALRMKRRREATSASRRREPLAPRGIYPQPPPPLVVVPPPLVEVRDLITAPVGDRTYQ
jgi:hypothetical protein